MKTLTRYFNEINDLIKSTKITNETGSDYTIDEGMLNIIQSVEAVTHSNNIIYFIGNGASASIASHMALDFWKNKNIKSQALNDMVALTAVSNDINYESVFSHQLSTFLNKGDLVFVISSSGNSKNMIKAAEVTKSKGGKCITLSGMGSDNQLRHNGDINLYVPADTYGYVESAHATIMHYILDEL